MTGVYSKSTIHRFLRVNTRIEILETFKVYRLHLKDLTIRRDCATSRQVRLIPNDDNGSLLSVMLPPQIIQYLLGDLEAGARDNGVDDDAGVRLVRRQRVLHLGDIDKPDYIY